MSVFIALAHILRVFIASHQEASLVSRRRLAVHINGTTWFVTNRTWASTLWHLISTGTNSFHTAIKIKFPTKIGLALVIAVSKGSVTG